MTIVTASTSPEVAAIQPAAAAAILPRRNRSTVLDRAMRTCNQVISAYDEGGKSGGSIDWADLDYAHGFAKKAIRAEQDHLRRGGVIAQLSGRELATVLAALRHFQQQPTLPADLSGHFADHNPLSAGQIDALCERLNT